MAAVAEDTTHNMEHSRKDHSADKRATAMVEAMIEDSRAVAIKMAAQAPTEHRDLEAKETAELVKAHDSSPMDTRASTKPTFTSSQSTANKMDQHS